MRSIRDRRDTGIRGRIARILFAFARWLLGNNIPQYYSHYADKVPPLRLVETLTDTVLSDGGVVTPERNRTAIIHLAQEVARLKRQQAIYRLAMHEAGILILNPEELARLKVIYSID